MSKLYDSAYDDEQFFESYVALREDETNYNDLIEQPAVLSLVGDVSGKRVLDIGCGYGATTLKLAEGGASRVLGIDVSEKMLALAREESAHENAEYRLLAAEGLSELCEEFDTAVSCLAVHYVEDLGRLFSDVYQRLSVGGVFVFSMEHPFYTSSTRTQRWLRDPENDEIVAFITDSYSIEGARHNEWLGKAVRKYHHKIETVFNSLILAGFKLEKICEPTPSEELMAKVERMKREYHRPVYLIVKCTKGEG